MALNSEHDLLKWAAFLEAHSSQEMGYLCSGWLSVTSLWLRLRLRLLPVPLSDWTLSFKSFLAQVSGDGREQSGCPAIALMKGN